MQRHGTVQALAARIRQDPQAFEEFSKKFTSGEFQNNLRRAVADPESQQAKDVLNKIMPVMTAGSRKTTFGALQRRSTAGEILAMGRKYGPASNFLTVSVDDVNSPGVLRMAFRSCDNLKFPAMAPDELLKAMELGDDYVFHNGNNCMHCLNGGKCHVGQQGEIKIPCAWPDLARVATENPVSVALHYKKLIYDLLTTLVGIKPGTTSGDGNRTTKTFYRGWKEDSLGVIVGTPAAYLGVTETTARGSLHFHIGECMLSQSVPLIFLCVPGLRVVAIVANIKSNTHAKCSFLLLPFRGSHLGRTVSRSACEDIQLPRFVQGSREGVGKHALRIPAKEGSLEGLGQQGIATLLQFFPFIWNQEEEARRKGHARNA